MSRPLPSPALTCVAEEERLNPSWRHHLFKEALFIFNVVKCCTITCLVRVLTPPQLNWGLFLSMWVFVYFGLLFIIYCLTNQIINIYCWKNVCICWKIEKIFATNTLLRMFFFAVRNNCYVLGKWLAWTEAECWFKGSASSPSPSSREILVCLLKLFYVALSWRQIRPHERAIMPPLVTAALRISASLLLALLGLTGGEELMRTCASCTGVPERRGKWLWTGNPQRVIECPSRRPRRCCPAEKQQDHMF